MTDNYMTLDSLKAALRVTNTADDDILQRSIYEAQTFIESVTHRTFLPSTDTRYYRSDSIVHLDAPGGSGPVLVLGKDLLTLGGLTNGDGTTIASTDCWVEPRNQPPYQYVRLKSSVSWLWDTDGEITVTGTWGYSTAVPDDVVQACKQMAGYYYKLKNSSVVDVIGSAETGQILVARGIPAGVSRILLDGGYVKSWRIV